MVTTREQYAIIKQIAEMAAADCSLPNKAWMVNWESTNPRHYEIEIFEEWTGSVAKLRNRFLELMSDYLQVGDWINCSIKYCPPSKSTKDKT